MITRTVVLMLVLVWGQLVYSQSSVSINYNGGSGSPSIVDPSQTALADGNDVEIGYFFNFDLNANANNFGALAAARQPGGAWTNFGSTTITHSLLLPAGSFSSTATQSGGIAGQFAGHQIDLWVFQTSDNLAPASDFHNVLAYGIFSSTSASWIFPASGSFPVVDNINTSDVNTIYHGGQFGPSAGFPNGSLEVTAVPEPSTAALFSLGIVFAGMLGRRIRRA